MQKSIKVIVTGIPTSVGSGKLTQALPVNDVAQVDPFLLIHHGGFSSPGDRHQRDLGVGPHPHRGFSPVTFVYKGSIEHRDSLGHTAEVFKGGTQWVSAGKGIIHSERPGKEIADKGGESEIIQFWVNTPAKHKMDTPFYSPLSYQQTPKIQKHKTEILVVAGELDGVKGAMDTLTPQTLLRLTCESGADVNIDIPMYYNCLLYVLDGALEVNGMLITDKQMMVFENDGTDIDIKANKDTRAIILSGEPIGEEVKQYGPFVMNTQTEILEALRDSQMGKMGVLIEKFE